VTISSQIDYQNADEASVGGEFYLFGVANPLAL
jgi:hypothetical protein